MELTEALGCEPLALAQAAAVVPLSSAADPKPAWDALLTLERVGLININRLARSW